MTTTYILSQIAVVLAYVFLALTYTTKKRKSVLFYNFAHLIFGSISFLLLSAFMGLVMNFVAMVRNIIFLVQDKDKNSKYTYVDFIVLFSLIAIAIIFCFISYNGFLSLFSPLSTLLYTFAIWQRNIQTYKILGFFVSVFYLIYNISIGSLFGAICEGLLLIWIVVENILYFTKNKKLNKMGSDI